MGRRLWLLLIDQSFINFFVAAIADCLVGRISLYNSELEEFLLVIYLEFA